MLKINRLKIQVKTRKGLFGSDNYFDKKINFIASHSNTKGKSSLIESIYYCLGFEELVGGKGEKALKPVFRDKLIYNSEAEVKVIDTDFYLEVVGEGNVTKTLNRTAGNSQINSNLIRIYNGSISDVFEHKCTYEDTYVHLSGAASNEKGFHNVLEDFIGLCLPKVPCYDGENRKLYLQILFSSIFIEQKRGWAGLFAALPTYFKIRDPQKRSIEYLLNMDSLEIEKKKRECKDRELNIKREWELTYNNINIILNQSLCEIENIDSKPHSLEGSVGPKVYKILDGGKKEQIELYIERLKDELKKLESSEDTVGPHLSELEIEFYSKQDELLQIEVNLEEEKKKIAYEKQNIKSLKESLAAVEYDLKNNKEIVRLKKLGSDKNLIFNEGKCPLCRHNIQDSLITPMSNVKVMSIEENIRHLESQENIIKFSLKSSTINESKMRNNIRLLEKKIITYRRILRSIKNDLYSKDKSISESIVMKKILIKNSIEDLKYSMEEVNEQYKRLIYLSNEWVEISNIYRGLPKTNFSKNDKMKIESLKDNFVYYLNCFGYDSVGNISRVEISPDKLIPIINGFDIKFDSSASDGVRVIWAFTLSLLKTSLKYGGNHPGILIFDEPGQQSMVVGDLLKLIDELEKLDERVQVIIGITLDGAAIEERINTLDKLSTNLILVQERSITYILDENEF